MTPPADKILGQLFEEAREAIFLLDPESDRILDANRAASALLGYTREELLITPISAIHPAELERVREFRKTVELRGYGWTIGLTCKTKSGVFLPTEISALSLDRNGHLYVFALVRDRSDHRGSDVH